MRNRWLSGLAVAFGSAGCLHGGFGFPSHMGGGGGGFHADAPVPHVSAPPVAPPAPHVTVSSAAPSAAAPLVLQTAAELVTDAAEIAAVTSSEAEVEEEEPAPWEWANVATEVSMGARCSSPVSTPLSAATLHRNASLTLYLASEDGTTITPSDVFIRLDGPIRLAAPPLDGNALTLFPEGPLGTTGHIAVTRRATGATLTLDIATVDSDAPCRG
jgi:hypothetical protein